MQVPPRERTSRRNETRDLTRPILVSLNRMPGVRLARNNGMGKAIALRFYQHLLKTGRPHPDAYPMAIGLGVGGADLVGVVTCEWGRLENGPFAARYVENSIGRVFCLEVKWPGRNPEEDQLVWLRTVRSLGGFATVVHSVEEAHAAVLRCREGLSE